VTTYPGSGWLPPNDAPAPTDALLEQFVTMLAKIEEDVLIQGNGFLHLRQDTSGTQRVGGVRAGQCRPT
jgi:hypothetical protein